MSASEIDAELRGKEIEKLKKKAVRGVWGTSQWDGESKVASAWMSEKLSSIK